MAAMRATFYGGPADGGELTLAEPVRGFVRFPITAADAAHLLDHSGPNDNAKVAATVTAGEYRLDMVAPGRPWRDSTGRLRYLYVRPHPNPKETETDD